MDFSIQKNTALLISLPLVVAAAAVAAAVFFGPPRLVHDGALSGWYLGNYRWSGEIIATGDVTVLGKVMVDSGTKVRVEASDDRHSGGDAGSYEAAHIEIFIAGKLIVAGTERWPVVFTSAGSPPHADDWQGLAFRGDGSMIDHAIIDYSRDGLVQIGRQPHSMVRDSVVLPPPEER